MEELQGLEKLGNAAAVPAIIFFTQLIKKRLLWTAKYSSDAVALTTAFVMCTLWTFYEMTPEEYALWANYDALEFFKWGIDRTITGFATWLAASKIYDLGHGNRKRDESVSIQIERQLEEQLELQKEILKLKDTQVGADEQGTTGSDISEKLRKILEG